MSRSVQLREFTTAAQLVTIGTAFSLSSVTSAANFTAETNVHMEVQVDINAATLIAALIEKTADVVGGSARVARTRIPVWTLENLRRMGASDEAILQAFPTVRKVDLSAAWAYVLLNREDVDRDIAENDAA